MLRPLLEKKALVIDFEASKTVIFTAKTGKKEKVFEDPSMDLLLNDDLCLSHKEIARLLKLPFQNVLKRSVGFRCCEILCLRS